MTKNNNIALVKSIIKSAVLVTFYNVVFYLIELKRRFKKWRTN